MSTELRYWLHRYLGRYEDRRSHSEVHASDLLASEHEFCPREIVLLDKSQRTRRARFLSTAQNVVYRGSRLWQAMVTEWVIEMMESLPEAPRAYGNWECIGCREVKEFTTRPDPCTCGCEAWTYHELSWVSGYSGIEGNIDLTLDFGEATGFRIYEIKAVQEKDFKPLVGPIAEHRWRTNLYLRIIRESEDPNAKRINTSQGWVLYMAKGGFGVRDSIVHTWQLGDADWSPFKEYTVKRCDKDTQKLVDRARAVQLYREGKGPLPERVCPTLFARRAKACDVSDHCFGAF